MRITCPGCSAQYEVDPEEIDAEGRLVECPECDTVWKQFPDGRIELPQVAAAVAPTPSYEAEPPDDEPQLPETDPDEIIREAMAGDSGEVDAEDTRAEFESAESDFEPYAEDPTEPEPAEISAPESEDTTQTDLSASLSELESLSEPQAEPDTDQFQEETSTADPELPEPIADPEPPETQEPEAQENWPPDVERHAQPPSVLSGAHRIPSGIGQGLPGVEDEASPDDRAATEVQSPIEEEDTPRPWEMPEEPASAAMPEPGRDDFARDSRPSSGAELEPEPPISSFDRMRTHDTPAEASDFRELRSTPDPETEPPVEEDLESVLSAAIEEHHDEPEPTPPRRHDDQPSEPAPGQTYIGVALDRLAKSEEESVEEEVDDSIRAAMGEETGRRKKGLFRRDEPANPDQSYTLGDPELERRRTEGPAAPTRKRGEKSRKMTRAEKREMLKKRKERLAQYEGPKRNLTLRGFAIAMILFGLATAVYMFDRDIVRTVPQAKPYLLQYTEFVDELRVTTRVYAEPVYDQIGPFAEQVWAEVEPILGDVVDWGKDMVNNLIDLAKDQIGRF